MKVEKLYEFVMSTVLGQDVPKSEKSCTLLISTQHHAMEMLDRPERDVGVGRWSSTEDLLMDYLQKKKLWHRADHVLPKIFGWADLQQL